jgi:ABC-type bacteriocin/lantibiotic exporter with double-glycine peptidase domain
MRLPQESRSGAVNRFFRRIRGEIRLENVGFRYPAQASPALRGIDASIAAGEFVVVTGAQDAGRSTLLKLLANLYQPSFGRILIDGSDASQFDIRELRCAIALVNDEQTIFADTLAQNLAFANPPATREQMARAVRDADLATFVEQLEDGLDADLSDLLAHGLSGVVRQKIRLARAYLAAPKIYLFDDPLNDLDESGRLALLAKLRSLKREATIVVTEPDAEILKLADRVIGMKAGQLAPPVIGGKLAPPRRAPQPAPASSERLPVNSTIAEYSKGSSS